MSWQEVGMVVLGGTALATLNVIAIVVMVSLLPLTDKAKLIILFSLGLVNLFISYEVLIRMPPNSQNIRPATINPTDHSHDCCNAVRGINRILVHKPTIPKVATAIRKSPTIKVPNTINAFIKYLHKIIIDVLRYVL